MNAVEIEEAVSRLAEEPFDAESFPYAFLEAFGNKATTLQRLRSGNTNQSDIPGAVLQRNNIHILATKEGEVANALAALRSSPATSRQKCKFLLATDGKTLEAENLAPPMIATTKRWSASTSAAVSRTTRSGWKNSSNSTPK